jgi:hypothetical protein
MCSPLRTTRPLYSSIHFYKVFAIQELTAYKKSQSQFQNIREKRGQVRGKKKDCRSCIPTRRRTLFFFISFCFIFVFTYQHQAKRPTKIEKTYQKHQKISRSRRSSQSKVDALLANLRGSNTYRSQKVSNLRCDGGRRRGRHTSRVTRHRSIKRRVNTQTTVTATSFSFSKNRGSCSSTNPFTRRNLRLRRQTQRSRRPSISRRGGVKRVSRSIRVFLNPSGVGVEGAVVVRSCGIDELQRRPDKSRLGD